LHCEKVLAIFAMLFPGATIMFYDALTHFLRSLFVVLASSSFLLLAAVRLPGQELKEFDSDYLQSPAGGPELNKAEQEIVRLTNEFRRQHGLDELKSDKRLDKAAGYFAAYMARTDKYGHEADGNRPADRMSLYDYDHCIAAENIAYQMKSTGFSTDELAKGFFDGWKNSPPHRENLLDPDLKEVGVAIGHAPGSDRYYAVQDFGRPKSASTHFQISNQTADTLHYKLKTVGRGKPSEESLELPPKTTMFHTRCRPTTIDWGWTEKDDGVKVGDKQEFVITKTADGYRVTR
jgi:uncharacterized protein YkwD